MCFDKQSFYLLFFNLEFVKKLYVFIKLIIDNDFKLNVIS